MEQFLYERPREKLQHRGASFLTVPELLQIVIGSGTAKVSGARLAKRAAKMLDSQPPMYANLRAIEGLGHAKACQILAALELGARYAKAASMPVRSSATPASALVAAARSGAPQGIVACFYDGSAAIIETVRYQGGSSAHLAHAQKSILNDAFRVSAHAVELAVKEAKGALYPSHQLLAFTRALATVFGYFQVKLIDVWGVTKTESRSYRKELP